MKQQKDIPILLLEAITRDGLKITRHMESSNQDILFKSAHRDDHYIFVFQLQGTSRIMIDFNEIALNGCTILCILPGQVHQGIAAQNVEAWFIAIETSLIKESLQSVFQEKTPSKACVALTSRNSVILEKCIKLLEEVSNPSSEGGMGSDISRSLTDACMAMIAENFDIIEDLAHDENTRPVVITKQFRRLLSKSFKEERSPSGYARSLNISASYLNEAVKRVTGFSASYWIQQQIVIEAKRVLFYTDSSIKEVAAQLGFEDHHYFSRFFTKGAGISPMFFRKQYRK